MATENEIKKGKAQILSTVDSAEAQYYDIEILKINSDSSDNKNMVIQVTDSELISCGITANTIRFSCGLENAEDIIADLKQALED